MNRVETLRKIHRHEGIDVLRVIAIFMIVVSHSLPRYGNYSNPGYIDFAQAQRNFSYFVCATFFYFGQIGNCIFIICSSWFLADDDEVKYKKVVHLISDTLCISVLWLLVIWLCKFDLSITDLIKSFFPITFGYNWFVGCYILFYLLHKIINKSIKDIPRKTMLKTNIILTFLYSFIVTLLGKRYYYTELTGFILIYLWIKYLKKYNIRYHKYVYICILMISTIMLIGLEIITNFIGLKYSFFSDQVLRWCIFNNPIIMIMSGCMFFIFKSLNVKKLLSKLTGKIACLSLLVYVLSENLLLNSKIKPLIWDYIFINFSYQHLVLWVLLISVLFFLGALIISILFKNTVQKIAYLCFDAIFDKMQYSYNKLICKICDRNNNIV